jgi:biopolymer transport protein ExbB
VVLIGASVFAASAYAQTAAPADAGAAPTKHTGLVSLILSNTDFVFFTIMGLSILGLTLIIQGFIKNRQSVFMPDDTTEQIREMINQRKFKELLEYTRDDPSFISKVLHPALNRAPAFNAMKEAMETAIGEQTAERFRAIEYLNIIGNLGPLLGLLGTVLGMIAAFSEMMDAGANGADPSKLAGGISKALCHTFLGLMLAVPCLASFGILRTIVDRLTVRGALLAEELLLLIKPQQDTAKPAAPAAARPGMATPQPGMPPAPAGIRKAPMPPPAPAV